MNNSTQPSVLAIETSTAACSVALLLGDKSYSRHEILPQRHAQQVLVMVDEVIKEAAIDSSDIDYLAFGEGPGAFTGLRIAAGVVQGLALGWQKPVIAVSSLQALAQQFFVDTQNTMNIDSEKPTQWAAVMDARMNEIYLLKGKYDTESGLQITDQVALLNESQVDEQIKACDVVFGDIEKAYPELLRLLESNGVAYQAMLPNALYMAQIGRECTAQAKTIEEQVPQPLYLRNNVAETIEQRKRKQQS